VAVAKVVAASEQIIGIKVVVDLADEAVHAVEEASGGGKIVAIRAA